MIIKELTPNFDSCQSFYGKARIKQNKNILILQSYSTNILEYNTNTKKIKFLTDNKNNFTATTNRHINEFLQQFTNETKKTKSQLLKMANIK